MSDPSDATLVASAERLAGALTAFGVTGFDSLGDLLAWKPEPEKTATSLTAGVTIRPSIRVQEHHDITPALFIYDPFLGTIGLVEILPSNAVCTSNVDQDPSRSSRESVAPSLPPKVTDSIREFVDRAAYFRQLCLLHAERTETQAHSVELVIVFQRYHPQETKADAAAVLHALSSETGYMRSIGVNLLDEQPDGTFALLADTFPWLLSATRRWFKSAHIRRDTSGSENLPWGIALRNYRHAGGRRFKFAPGKFHLMHGYNGSGKSSLSEALELLLVRSIERLDHKEKARYFPFVRFRPPISGPAPAPATPAKVILRMRTATDAIKAKVSICPPAGGVDQERRHRWSRPVVPLPSAASFRLDQRLMDFIIQASDARRAGLFLKAYFPTDQSALDAESTARDAADAAFARLPASIRDAAAASTLERAAFLRDALAWTGREPAAWQPRVLRGEMLQMVASCLPVPAERLELLAVLQPSLRDRIRDWRERPTTVTDVEEQLQKLDQDLAVVRSGIPSVLHNLEVAVPILRQFNAWRAEQQTTSLRAFRESVDRWLELQALADLVAKYHDVAATLERARALGWSPRPEHEGLLDDVHESPERLQLLEQRRLELTKDRDEARASVRSSTQREDATAATSAGASGLAVLLHFTDEQLECLNQAGEWLPSCAGGPDAPPLGQVLRAARRENKTAARGKSSIGVPGGLDAAIAEGERLADACRTLQASTIGAAEAYRACGTGLQAFNALEQVEQKATATFFRKLEKKNAEGLALIDALNELLSLFKPAPWAYTGVTLQAVKRSDNAPEQLALRRTGDESEAELVLNTAEMNTFTLALFFLCAPGVDNPLKLLVLDDPLQNMDEMTVSSLARGLGKVMRIFPDGWRVLALFHGEEDVYRLRDEIRTSVYRLPWVSPTTAPAAATTTVDAVAMHGTDRIELQNITQIIAVRVPAAAAV